MAISRKPCWPFRWSDDDLRHDAERIAENEGRSLNYIVNEAVRQYVKTRKARRRGAQS